MESLILLLFRFAFLLFVILSYYVYLRVNTQNLTVGAFFKNFIGVFSIAFIIVHIIVPIVQDFFPSYYRLSEAYEFETKFYSTVFVFVFYVAFLVSYGALGFIFIKRKNSLDVVSISVRNLFRFKSKLINFIFLIIPVLLSLLFIFKLLYSSNISELLVNRIALFRGLGAILLLSNILVFISIFYFLRFYFSRKKSDIFVYILIFILMLIVFTLIGSRNSFFIFLIANLIVFYKVGGNMSSTKLISWSMVSLLFFTLVGFFRVRTGQFGDVELIELLVSNMVTSIISVFGTDEILLYAMSNNFNDFQFGNTFAAAIANFVPRGVWPEKPLGAGPLITNFINPGSYGLELSNVSSYTTGIIAESYLNFGWFGLIIVPLFLALIAHLVEAIRINNFYTLMIYSYFLVMFAFSIFYAEFLGLLSRAIYVSLPLFLCIIFNYISTNKRRMSCES